MSKKIEENELELINRGENKNHEKENYELIGVFKNGEGMFKNMVVKKTNNNLNFNISLNKSLDKDKLENFFKVEKKEC